jgi:hypothetical protein
MGSASSKTIADHFTNATASESASTTQDSVCNAYCGNVINISANRAARDQDITVDGNDQSCQIHCKEQSHMKSLIEQQIDQNIISQIKQESTAKIKGINLLNFSSAVAQANQTTNASIKTASNIDQKCLINMMGSNIINISGNTAGRDQTVTVTGQKQKTALDGIIECGLDSSVYQAESQQLKIMTTQKASASTIGVDPIGLLIALLVAFLVTFVGPVIMPVIAIKMLKSTIGELAPVAVLAFVITIVCLIVSIYFFVRYYGQLNESHSQSSSWNPSSAPDLYQEMKVQVQDPSSDQIKWLPEPEGSGHNLFITPYSTMGARTYPSDDSETAVISGPTPIWKSGILNSEIPEYSSIWADAIPDYDVIIYDPTGSTRVPAINPSTDYQGPIQIKTEDDYENPQKLATWLNLHPEYISFEWFGYYIDSVSRDMIKLKNPVIVLHRSLPEEFWNWDSIKETLCLTCVESDAPDETDETDAPDEDASKAAQACKGVWGKCHGKIKQQGGQLPGDTVQDVKLEPRMNYTDNIEFINDFYPTWNTGQPGKCGINISKPDKEGNTRDGKQWGETHFRDVPMNQGFNGGINKAPLCSDGGIDGGIGQLNTEDFAAIDGYETAKTAFRAAKTAQAQGPTAGIDATSVLPKTAVQLSGELATARIALEDKVSQGIAAKYAVNPQVNQVFDFSTSTNDINLWSKVDDDDQHTFARATEAGYCNVTTEQRNCGTPGSQKDFNVRCFPSGPLPSGDSVTVAKDTLTDGVGDKCTLNTTLNICEKKEPICADVGPTIMCGANESSWTDWSKKNVLNPYKTIAAQSADSLTGCNALLNNMSVLTPGPAAEAIKSCQDYCCVAGDDTWIKTIARVTVEAFEVAEAVALAPFLATFMLGQAAFNDENFADTFKDDYENAADALEASNNTMFGVNSDGTKKITSGRGVFDVKCDWSDSAVQTGVQFYPRTPIWPNTTGIKMFRDGSEMDPYWFPLSARSYIYIKVSLAAIVAFCAVFSLIMQLYHGDGSSSGPSAASAPAEP